ncbi:MAG: glycosyltransferase family 39 protein [Acidimicrobiales bacterium]|nr:glycosyltransferase family 39 protein [Acidimicrobiales bacterium]
MTERRYRILLGVAVAVALALRVAWVLWASREPTTFYLDPARYLGYARQIADGNGMVEGLTNDPSAYYPPGYPWFLGIVTWASGPFTDAPWVAAGLVQAVLGAASTIFVAIVARRFAGDLAALVAAGLYAIYPNLVFHTGVLLSETLYNFFFLAFLALLLARPWTAERSYRWVAACGVLLGLAVMVRPISLAIVPIIGLAWLWARKDWGIALRWTAVLVAGIAACILPWTIRNAIRLDAFVPISTNTGDNLCIGHADGATGSFTPVEACQTDHEFLDGLPAELASDKEKQRIAIEGAIDNWDREPWLLWRRVYFTWVRDGDHDGLFAVQEYRRDRWMAISTEARLIALADRIYWPVTIVGVAGLVVLGRRRRPEEFAFVGAAVMTALVPLAFFGDQRFKVPVIPMLIVAAGVAVAGAVDALGRRREAG